MVGYGVNPDIPNFLSFSYVNRTHKLINCGSVMES